jgi:hypothetical protein
VTLSTATLFINVIPEIRKLMTAKQEYYQVTVEEFEQFLANISEFTRVRGLDTDQIVYEINLPKENLSVRIFSSIVGETARDCGEDSINAVVWHDKADCPVGGRERTHRQPNWANQLEPKIKDLLKHYRTHVTKFCPKCDDALVTTSAGPFREYLDCYNCDYSESL